MRNALKVVLFGSRTYSQKITNLFGSSIVSYLPLSEGAGSVAADIGGRGNNGAYSGVTLAQPGIGDGRTSASLDGTTSYVHWYSAGLNAAFNNAEGTLAVWVKVSAAGVWTDGTTRRIAILRTDANNLVLFERSTTNNLLTMLYIAGGTTDAVTTTSLGGSTGWFHLALTWSKEDDELKAYAQGAQIGTTQTGLGTWVGALTSAVCALGATNTTPNNPFSGNLAHALLLNRAATAAEIAAAYAI